MSTVGAAQSGCVHGYACWIVLNELNVAAPNFMRQIVLDGSRWTSSDDVYNSFLMAVGAPTWHGHNLDALHDSIAAGQINSIEVPYKIQIKNFGLIGAGARHMALDFVELIRELRDGGCPVDIQVDD